MLGVVFALGAALCYGASSAVVGRAVSADSPLMVGFISLLSGLALIGIVTGISEVLHPTLGDITLAGVPAVIAAALLTFVIGRLGYYTSIQKIGPSQSAALTATTSVVVAVIAVAVLGARLSPVAWAGVLLTASGVVVVVSGRSS